ncbi:MAG TPA: Rmf/CrpP family protein, partial [Paraburkholderia sp.]
LSKWFFDKDSSDTGVYVAALMDEGRAAYKTRTACPYAKGTPQHKAWMRGWAEAEHEKMSRW